MEREKLNLTWLSYTDHLKQMLHHMMLSDEFTDVTLVSEDKRHYKAHKVVLSAISPVFKSIINDYFTSVPVIYLRGIKSLDIESILQYVYLGEATVLEDRVNEFLDVAKSLEIKTISNHTIKNERNENIEFIEVNHGGNEQQHLEAKDSTKDEFQLKENITDPSKSHKTTNDEKSIHSCDHCSKSYSGTFTLMRHIQAIHRGVKFNCNTCNKSYADESKLKRHIKIIHEGFKYQCSQCEYETGRQDVLKKHAKLIHEHQHA